MLKGCRGVRVSSGVCSDQIGLHEGQTSQKSGIQSHTNATDISRHDQRSWRRNNTNATTVPSIPVYTFTDYQAQGQTISNILLSISEHHPVVNSLHSAYTLHCLEHMVEKIFGCFRILMINYWRVIPMNTFVSRISVSAQWLMKLDEATEMVGNTWKFKLIRLGKKIQFKDKFCLIDRCSAQIWLLLEWRRHKLFELKYVKYENAPFGRSLCINILKPKHELKKYTKNKCRQLGRSSEPCAAFEYNAAYDHDHINGSLFTGIFSWYTQPQLSVGSDLVFTSVILIA